MCICDATFQASAAEKPRSGTTNRTGAPRGTVPRRYRALRRSRDEFNAQSGGAVTRGHVNATRAIFIAGVRHHDGNVGIDLVIRPWDTDRTPLGQDSIARPVRHARIRCEGSCGVLRQTWGPLFFAAITTCGCEVAPKRPRLRNGAFQCRNCTKAAEMIPLGSSLMYQREEAFGFAICKLCCWHALQNKTSTRSNE